jgi:hypothetical protein
MQSPLIPSNRHHLLRLRCCTVAFISMCSGSSKRTGHALTAGGPRSRCDASFPALSAHTFIEDMFQVCQQLIKPLAARSRCSFCYELQITSPHMLGAATWFVSHTWSYAFADVIDAVCLYFDQHAASVKVTVKVLVKICYTRTQVGYTGPPFSKEHCASIMVGRQVHTHKQLTFIVCYVDHSSIREEQAI